MCSSDLEQFAEVSIPAVTDGQPDGTTTTWAGLLDEIGGATVLLPALADADVLGPALDAAEEAGAEQSIIVRSDQLEVLSSAAQRGFPSMAVGDAVGEAASDVLLDADASEEEIAAAARGGVRVWIDSPADAAALTAAHEAGAFGAIAGNPFTVLPQDTRD